MRALSVRQPYAEAIAAGKKRWEYRTWQARTIIGDDLLIVASCMPAEPSGETLPRGVAVCVVRVTEINGEPGDYAWRLVNPRRVEPVPIRGFAALYHVPDVAIRYLTGVRAVDAAAPEAPRSRVRARAKRAAPYTFAIGDAPIRGEGASTPEAARARAAELARERGAPVWIERDGIAIAEVAP